VNDDSKVDLLVADYFFGTLRVWTNNGSGIFSSNRTYSIIGGASDLKLADINGDAKLDLIVAGAGSCPSIGPPCSSGTLMILTNNGSNIFGWNTSVSAGVWTTQVIPGEVNGDGKLDLICLNLGYSGYASNTFIEFFNTSTFPSPKLKFARSGNNMSLEWPSSAGNFVLQTNTDLGTTNWVNYAGTVSDNGLTKSVTNAASASKLFFRLKQ
jgi:hypothetical protein